MQIDNWIYEKQPELKVSEKSPLPFYKRLFCSHNRNNHAYFYLFRDICFDYCPKCKQWVNASPSQTGKLIRHMAGGKY